MPKGQIDYILIYKANDKGFPGANGISTMPATGVCPANCVKFVWRTNVTPNAFRYNSGAWDSKSINACVNDSTADTLGIYMHATHDFLTGFIGLSSASLEDRSVMKFEPLPWDTCKPGASPPHP